MPTNLIIPELKPSMSYLNFLDFNKLFARLVLIAIVVFIFKINQELGTISTLLDRLSQIYILRTTLKSFFIRKNVESTKRNFMFVRKIGKKSATM